ncbi:MAG: hypothetical protein ACE366_18525 [Bradymonadia bacterium]
MKKLVYCLVAFSAFGCDNESPSGTESVIDAEVMDNDPDVSIDEQSDSGVEEQPDAEPEPMPPDAEPPHCGDPAELSGGPLPFETLQGFSGGEDFVFDAEGYLVSVDGDGNLTRQPKEGDAQLITPGFEETAGTRMLPNGDFIVANVADGALVRVTPEGGKSVVITGMQYPNGVEVSDGGTVYVADQNAGNVREVDVENGESTIIAEDLFNPNGVALSPDEQVLYVGSFGGGTVHAIHRSAEGWEAPVLLAQVSEPGGTPCENVDDACEIFGQPGLCVEDGGGALYCEPEGGDLGDFEHERCEMQGAPCGDDGNRICISANDTLICPAYSADYVIPCEGASDGTECTVLGVEGTCTTFGPSDGFTVCYPNDEVDPSCAEQGAGDACTTLWGTRGSCIDQSEFGFEGLYCAEDGFGGGGFDEESCEGLELGERCALDGDPTGGVCMDGELYGFEGTVCLPNEGGFDERSCMGLEEGDRCAIDGEENAGRCEDGTLYGIEGLVCSNGGFGEGPGGLDGVMVDACGNVYITEYTTGKIYRVSPDGEQVETFVKLPSPWIPNMRWGNGMGGFETDTMYIMDRESGRLFTVIPGVGGARQ